MRPQERAARFQSELWKCLGLLRQSWSETTAQRRLGCFCFERLDPESFGSLLHPNAVVPWKIVDILNKPAWPADRCRHGAFGLPESEEYLFAVLGKESGSGLKHARLTSRLCFHGNCRTNGVAIALGAAQPEGNRGWEILHRVLQKAHLWGIAVFQQHFLPAILIKVGESERSAVFEKIHSYYAGDVGKRSDPDCSHRRHFAPKPLQVPSALMSSLMALHPCSY